MNLLAKTKSKLASKSLLSKEDSPPTDLPTPEQQAEQAYDDQIGQTSTTATAAGTTSTTSRARAFSLGRKTPLQRAPPSFQRHGGSLNPAGNVREEGMASGDVPPIPSNAHVHGDFGISDLDRYRLETVSAEPGRERRFAAPAAAAGDGVGERRKEVTFA